jgi:hypothetical protein
MDSCALRLSFMSLSNSKMACAFSSAACASANWVSWTTTTKSVTACRIWNESSTTCGHSDRLPHLIASVIAVAAPASHSFSRA